VLRLVLLPLRLPLAAAAHSPLRKKNMDEEPRPTKSQLSSDDRLHGHSAASKTEQV